MHCTVYSKVLSSYQPLVIVHPSASFWLLQAADVPGTKRVVLAIVQICRDAGEWKLLNENIVLLSKRRAQLKQASPPYCHYSTVLYGTLLSCTVQYFR